jgi:hypothetical protein
MALFAATSGHPLQISKLINYIHSGENLREPHTFATTIYATLGVPLFLIRLISLSLQTSFLRFKNIALFSTTSGHPLQIHTNEYIYYLQDHKEISKSQTSSQLIDLLLRPRRDKAAACSHHRRHYSQIYNKSRNFIESETEIRVTFGR